MIKDSLDKCQRGGLLSPHLFSGGVGGIPAWGLRVLYTFRVCTGRLSSADTVAFRMAIECERIEATT